MIKEIIIAVVSTIAIALLSWFIAGGRTMWDRHKIYQWLKLNTVDEPGKSHTDIMTIAKGTWTREDRVYRACMSSSKIYCYSNNNKTCWSVWRKEPQSIYDNLTKEEIKKKLIRF